MAPPKGWVNPRKGIFSDSIPRFWSKVKKTKHCWEWTAGISDGYGYFTTDGISTRVHRFSYELHKGRIPEGMFVCHTCDNRACVNPKHLWIGDHTANMRDMHFKGRANNRGRARGERSARSKLTSEQVREIRNLLSAGKHTKAANGIHSIAIRESWYWLD